MRAFSNGGANPQWEKPQTAFSPYFTMVLWLLIFFDHQKKRFDMWLFNHGQKLSPARHPAKKRKNPR